MRDFIGLIVGLYLTAALVVFGGAAYSFMSGEHAKLSPCAVPAGSTAQQNWVPWALYRASIWPKTYFDEAGKTGGLVDWLLVRYNPFAGNCG